MCKQALVFKTSFISALDPELTWYSSSFVFSICVLCRQGNLPTQEVFSPAGDNFTLGDIQWDDYPLVSGFPRRPGLCDPAVGMCKRASAYIACISLLPWYVWTTQPIVGKNGRRANTAGVKNSYQFYNVCGWIEKWNSIIDPVEGTLVSMTVKLWQSPRAGGREAVTCDNRILELR